MQWWRSTLNMEALILIPLCEMTKVSVKRKLVMVNRGSWDFKKKKAAVNRFRIFQTIFCSWFFGRWCSIHICHNDNGSSSWWLVDDPRFLSVILTLDPDPWSWPPQTNCCSWDPWSLILKQTAVAECWTGWGGNPQTNCCSWVLNWLWRESSNKLLKLSAELVEVGKESFLRCWSLILILKQSAEAECWIGCGGNPQTNCWSCVLNWLRWE